MSIDTKTNNNVHKDLNIAFHTLLIFFSIQPVYGLNRFPNIPRNTRNGVMTIQNRNRNVAANDTNTSTSVRCVRIFQKRRLAAANTSSIHGISRRASA